MTNVETEMTASAVERLEPETVSPEASSKRRFRRGELLGAIKTVLNAANGPLSVDEIETGLHAAGLTPDKKLVYQYLYHSVKTGKGGIARSARGKYTLNEPAV